VDYTITYGDMGWPDLLVSDAMVMMAADDNIWVTW
jgi:hypothetical protein